MMSLDALDRLITAVCEEIDDALRDGDLNAYDTAYQRRDELLEERLRRMPAQREA